MITRGTPIWGNLHIPHQPTWTRRQGDDKACFGRLGEPEDFSEMHHFISFPNEGFQVWYKFIINMYKLYSLLISQGFRCDGMALYDHLPKWNLIANTVQTLTRNASPLGHLKMIQPEKWLLDVQQSTQLSQLIYWIPLCLMTQSVMIGAAQNLVLLWICRAPKATLIRSTVASVMESASSSKGSEGSCPWLHSVLTVRDSLIMSDIYCISLQLSLQPFQVKVQIPWNFRTSGGSGGGGKGSCSVAA